MSDRNSWVTGVSRPRCHSQGLKIGASRWCLSIALLLACGSARQATAQSPFLVKDINPGPSGSQATQFVELNGVLLFSAHDDGAGRELWRTDGTSDGTVRVADLQPGPGGGNPRLLGRIGETILFSASNDITFRSKLWRTDGTAAGTVLVSEVAVTEDGPEVAAAVNGALYFAANDGVHGFELWRSDGTTAGTFMVKDIRPGSASSMRGAYVSALGNVVPVRRE